MPATFSNTNPSENVFIQRLVPTDSNLSSFSSASPMQYALNSTMLAVGLYNASPVSSGISQSGAVLIYKLTDGVWSQDSLVLASDAAANDGFGYSISISEDGLHLVVGARVEDSSGSTDNGAFYYFTRSGSTWTQQQKVLPPEGMGSDTYITFGASVKLSNNSNVLFVGAPARDGSSLSDAGKVFIYTRSGSTWTYSTSIVSSDLSIQDNFGWSLDLSRDGTTLVVGAPGESINYTGTPFNNGAVYIFTGSGTSWTQQGGKLNASDPGTGNNLGLNVAISSNGNTVIASAPYWNSSNIGSSAVYIFTRSGTTWSQLQRLNVPTLTGNEDAYYGMSISPDGNTIAVGAHGVNISPYTASGAVYVYSKSVSTFSLIQTISASDAATNNRFGASTLLNSTGDLVVSTAYSFPVKVYIYKIGKKLDNKFYFYNSTSNKWEVSLHTETSRPLRTTFTSSGNWVMPLGAKIVNVVCVGAGGGGGGGGRNIPGGTSSGGGLGGGGGGVSEFMFRASDIGGAGTYIPITIGSGGAGGAATASGTDFASGNAGSAGGDTSFGSYLKSIGGIAGPGGTLGGTSVEESGFGMWTGNYSSLSIGAGGGGGGRGGSSDVGIGIGSAGSIPTSVNLTATTTSGQAGASNTFYNGAGAGGHGGEGRTGSAGTGGAGGFPGGGGGGGGEGSTTGTTGAGGAGGAGAAGMVSITVWYG